MFIALSFKGNLPSYIHQCVHQIKLFFDGDIYLITDNPPESIDAKIINYDSVSSKEFNEVLSRTYHKFCIVHGLSGREELFIRSLERFFLLQNLMKQENLTDCLFLEIDNLIYDNPENWLAEFSKNELCYMFDNFDRCSSGLMYVKQSSSLDGFLAYILDYMQNSNEFLNEMTCLYRYYENNKESVQILPTYWHEEHIPEMARMNYPLYKDSIFDALGMGIFLLGLDPFHTGGNVQTGMKGAWCAIDYTQQQFEWILDSEGRKIPHVLNKTSNTWIRINNLHVHSKQLQNGISREV